MGSGALAESVKWIVAGVAKLLGKRYFGALILEAENANFLHLGVFHHSIAQGDNMAGPAPKTRNWRARENAHKPKGLHIIVSGEVEVNATNTSPELAEAPHVGKTLPLDLTIVADSDDPLVAYKGKPVKVWKGASFHKTVSANQFERVSIRWDGKEIASIPVLDDREHGQHLAGITASANAKYGKKPAKPPAKKAAPKKAAAAKKKPKSVGGWAKPKKAKKSAKKAAKKTAKKTAKKSAFKKFVRKLVKKLTPASKKKSKRR